MVLCNFRSLQKRLAVGKERREKSLLGSDSAKRQSFAGIF